MKKFTQKRNFHQHQVEAFDRIIAAIQAGNGNAKGRVVIPTSGGKTWVQASIINYQNNNNNTANTHIVLAPTIMLTNKLIYEYRKFNGTKYREIAFHSGENPLADDTLDTPVEIVSTTKLSDVCLAAMDATKHGMDLVVFSTYHSCHQLGVLPNIITMIADESHRCVAKVFNKAVNSINAKVKLFFTATEKHTPGESGRGLNNTKMYGELLYSIPPKELIARGIILAPKLHVFNCRTIDPNETEVDYLVEMVSQMALHQHELASDTLGHSKILFAMRNTIDVEYIRKNIHVIKKSLPDHDIFTITARDREHINGIKCNTRDEFLDELSTPDRNCLIFHYDILSEGIDVDGITGVAFLRNMGGSKMIQTIGRSLRIYKENPKLKPCAYISVPLVNDINDDTALVRGYVRAIRQAGFSIMCENVIETGWDLRPSISKLDDTEILYGSSIFASMQHEVETEEYWNDIHALNSPLEQFSVLYGG